MPLRLSELVKHYPYASQPTDTSPSSTLSLQLPLLPRPRFSTRQYDALYIRIDTLLSPGAKRSEGGGDHPLHIIHEAVRAVVRGSDGGAEVSEEARAIWEDIRRRASGSVVSEKEGEGKEEARDAKKDGAPEEKVEEGQEKGPARDAAEIDRRVGELEKVVGSASTSLDEVSRAITPLLKLRLILV